MKTVYLVRCGFKNSKTWQLETVEEELGYYNPIFTSIAVNKNGLPHIAFTRRGRDRTDLKYAFKGAAGWASETIPIGIDAWDFRSNRILALDAEGLGNGLNKAVLILYWLQI